MIVVSNTSPLSAFLHINRLDILQNAFGTILIPEAVLFELQKEQKFTHDIQTLLTTEFIKVLKVKNRNAHPHLSTILDPGETEAIQLAIEQEADLILMDEKEGRNEANKIGIKVMGVLGVLAFAKKKGYISEVKPLLSQITKQANFWVAPSLIDDFLKSLGEN
jgi:hypothetical protein